MDLSFDMALVPRQSESFAHGARYRAPDLRRSQPARYYVRLQATPEVLVRLRSLNIRKKLWASSASLAISGEVRYTSSSMSLRRGRFLEDEPDDLSWRGTQSRSLWWKCGSGPIVTTLPQPVPYSVHLSLEAMFAQLVPQSCRAPTTVAETLVQVVERGYPPWTRGRVASLLDRTQRF